MASKTVIRPITLEAPLSLKKKKKETDPVRLTKATNESELNNIFLINQRKL